MKGARHDDLKLSKFHRGNFVGCTVSLLVRYLKIGFFFYIGLKNSRIFAAKTPHTHDL